MIYRLSKSLEIVEYLKNNARIIEKMVKIEIVEYLASV